MNLNHLHNLTLLMAAILSLKFTESTFLQPNRNCSSTCGNVTVPFPFGLSPGCYLNESYAILCDQTKNPPKPFLQKDVELLEISLPEHTLRVSNPVARLCHAGNHTESSYLRTNFLISGTANKLTGIGCDTVVLLLDADRGRRSITGCLAICDGIESVINGSCSGRGCCQTGIPAGRYYGVAVLELNLTLGSDFSSCSYAFLVEEKEYKFSKLDLKDLQKKQSVPMVLDWSVGNVGCRAAEMNRSTYACKAEHSECDDMKDGSGYRCFCSKGFQGNPYLIHGCQDIDECKEPNPCSTKCTNLPGKFSRSCLPGFEGDGWKNGTGCTPKPQSNGSMLLYILQGTSTGLLVLIAGSSWIYWIIRKRKLVKMREKFFERNGGLLLQQKLSTNTGSNAITIIFKAEELKKATNNFDESQVLGQGTFGTVYKGVLPDNRVVAIKKSKRNGQEQNEQFINEVVILSQINHRNVVKLLGCCLETEVPLLVYEFITNGSLFDNIHHECRLPWEVRLKIAVETAGALVYLHSATSTPIIHRDIKSANILLDEKYTAKVSDFGLSRLIPRDHTQLTTMIQGTFGYLDPEYFRSSQLTEKSDVYSFGVVLAELLTGQKAISFDREEGTVNLAMFFVSAMREARIVEILDQRLVRDDTIQQLKQVAMVAEWCLRVKSEERPTMKEVAVELEGLRAPESHTWGEVDLNQEELELTEYDSTKDLAALVSLGYGR